MPFLSNTSLWADSVVAYPGYSRIEPQYAYRVNLMSNPVYTLRPRGEGTDEVVRRRASYSPLLCQYSRALRGTPIFETPSRACRARRAGSGWKSRKMGVATVGLGLLGAGIIGEARRRAGQPARERLDLVRALPARGTQRMEADERAYPIDVLRFCPQAIIFRTGYICVPAQAAARPSAQGAGDLLGRLSRNKTSRGGFHAAAPMGLI